jgi:hypothetical protein
VTNRVSAQLVSSEMLDAHPSLLPGFEVLASASCRLASGAAPQAKLTLLRSDHGDADGDDGTSTASGDQAEEHDSGESFVVVHVGDAECVGVECTAALIACRAALGVQVRVSVFAQRVSVRAGPVRTSERGGSCQSFCCCWLWRQRRLDGNVLSATLPCTLAGTFLTSPHRPASLGLLPKERRCRGRRRAPGAGAAVAVAVGVEGLCSVSSSRWRCSC